MAEGRSDLETVLADAGGADAPREVSARLRDLLAAELRRGMVELGESRTGYGTPIAVAVAATGGDVVAALPISPELRADPGAVGERSGALAVAAVEHMVEGASPGPPRSGDDLALRVGELGGMLAFAYPAPEPGEAAEYAHEALTAEFDERRIDRLRARSHLLQPAGAVSRAHEDPDPVRRVARRILQRLDGMGKWGNYHTAFDHLARGFAGHERSLAYEVGESLLGAGLLEEKPSVGQRHVYLSPRRSGDIRRLIDDGELPQGLVLPPKPG